jgi:hypothetical protein
MVVATISRPQFGERQAGQRPRAFGGIPVAPGAAPQPVTEFGDTGLAICVGPVDHGVRGRGDRPQPEPAEEARAAAGLGGPVPEAGIPQVTARELGQHLVADLRQGFRAALQVAHDQRIAVQAEQARRVRRGEPPQRHSLGQHELTRR